MYTVLLTIDKLSYCIFLLLLFQGKISLCITIDEWLIVLSINGRLCYQLLIDIAFSCLLLLIEFVLPFDIKPHPSKVHVIVSLKSCQPQIHSHFVLKSGNRNLFVSRVVPNRKPPIHCQKVGVQLVDTNKEEIDFNLQLE